MRPELSLGLGAVVGALLVAGVWHAAPQSLATVSSEWSQTEALESRGEPGTLGAHGSLGSLRSSEARPAGGQVGQGASRRAAQQPASAPDDEFPFVFVFLWFLAISATIVAVASALVGGSRWVRRRTGPARDGGPDRSALEQEPIEDSFTAYLDRVGELGSLAGDPRASTEQGSDRSPGP